MKTLERVEDNLRESVEKIEKNLKECVATAQELLLSLKTKDAKKIIKTICKIHYEKLAYVESMIIESSDFEDIDSIRNEVTEVLINYFKGLLNDFKEFEFIQCHHSRHLYPETLILRNKDIDVLEIKLNYLSYNFCIEDISSKYKGLLGIESDLTQVERSIKKYKITLKETHPDMIYLSSRKKELTERLNHMNKYLEENIQMAIVIKKVLEGYGLSDKTYSKNTQIYKRITERKEDANV